MERYLALDFSTSRNKSIYHFHIMPLGKEKPRLLNNGRQALVSKSLYLI